MSDKEILDTAQARLKLVAGTEAKQRAREVHALRFQVPELQWDDAARQQRQGTSVGGPHGAVAIPPRPMLSIPKLLKPVSLVNNQAKQAHLAINVHPLSEKADKETAEVIQGVIRKIERDSHAHQARLWAFDRASKAGRGCYRVNTCYEDDTEFPFDLSIKIERILYQENVYFDPSAQQPDWSDGEWAFNVAWWGIDRFKREYPKSRLSSSDSAEWQSMIEEAPDWIEIEDKKVGGVMVAEYFVKTYKTEKILLIGNGQQTKVIQADNAIPRGWEILRERERKVPSVDWYFLSGADVLESKPWDGRYIPLIPVVGDELIPFDKERRWMGIIEPAIDAQKMYNFGATALVEAATLETKAPYLLDPRQVEGYEQWWAQANTRAFPYLPYNALQELPPPQRVQADTGKMGASMLMIQQGDEMIQGSTGVFDPALGNMGDQRKEKSGRAILALQQQSDAGNSHYLHNLAQISMLYEAKVLLDLIPTVYERPGRALEILTGEDKTRSVMLNVPFVMDQEGRPQMAQPGQQNAQQYDLRAGAYGVTVDIGKSYSSRLQQGQDAIGNAISALPPEAAMAVLPLYFQYQDFPGATEMAERLDAVAKGLLPALQKLDEEKNPDSPDTLRSKMQQLQVQNQQMQQQLQMAAQAIQTDQAKQQATMQKAALDAKSKSEADQVKLILEQMQAQFEAQQQANEQRFEAIQNALQRQHEKELEAMKLRAQAAQQMRSEMAEERGEDREDFRQGRQMRHEAGMDAAGRGLDARMTEREMSHEDHMADREDVRSEREADREDRRAERDSGE